MTNIPKIKHQKRISVNLYYINKFVCVLIVPEFHEEFNFIQQILYFFVQQKIKHEM